jgi:hypothetical protein
MSIKQTNELSDRASLTLENQIRVFNCLNLVDSLHIDTDEKFGVTSDFRRHLKIELTELFNDMARIIQEEVPQQGER